jgi:MFS family permease
MTALDAPDTLQDSYVKRPTRVRYLVVLGLAAASASAYLTRVAISPAATTIQGQFGFTDETMGAVLAAFSAGYFWCQVPGGWLANRFGSRITLSLFSVLWSLCSLWTGLAGSLSALWFSRMAAGVAQSGLVPCSGKVVKDWVPAAERGAASSAVTCSMSLGGVIATGLTAGLLPLLGWRGVFAAYSAVGIVWALAFYAGFRDRPEEHAAVNRSEANLIRGAAPSDTTPLSEPEQAAAARKAANWEVIRAMATSPSMAAICAQAFCRAFGAAFFLTWFPAYLEKSRGVQVASAGFLAMLPLAATVIGNLLGGTLVDRILSRTGNRRLSRSGTAALALGVCAVCTLAAAWVGSPFQAVCVLALGSLFFGLGSPAAWAAGMDISGRHTAILFGIMNMAGNFGAFLSPIAVGFLFAHIQRTSGDWSLVLYVFAGVYLAGSLCWALLDPERSAVERRS